MKFLKSVFSEMKQVTWPKGKVLAAMTWTVVSSIVVLAIFFGLVDSAISAAVGWLLSL
ncbi:MULTISPECIES: preprotein translocase subunit SecE [unclassified Granulicatella]|uniref:preprotein translocase subunit SecE n=1 Tax=unclassified Granulicatella TaxID=2630493 RepID=UPI0010737B23|nr:MULTISPECIES: preprotein translocase subunit SecE [unclassified Granulicatella]MBF0779706.1 preprotein translocase subunit SecE [Granulicatella sp. 19428wC4_WM01]TFU96227.1 preprotein translocase subunit SecE [Granulicatella sp. WM01]